MYVDSYGFHVGKYTIPMDSMGWKHLRQPRKTYWRIPVSPPKFGENSGFKQHDFWENMEFCKKISGGEV